MYLEDAIALAAAAHRGQKYGDGAAYIWHPIAVAKRVDDAGHDDDLVIVAMLHDVVEDADYDLDDLRKLGFNERVVAAVDAMSRRDGENYAEFIDRLKENPDAVIVKKADMECNMAHNCPEGLLKRYKKYYAVLEAA